MTGGKAMSASRPFGTALPTAIGATACAWRLAKSSGLQNCISICAAATDRLARAFTISRRSVSERLIEEHPDAAAAAVRAIVKTQKALIADPSLASGVG